MKLLNNLNIKQYILDNIDQVDIFVYYGNNYGRGGLTASDIHTSITRNSFMVKNPYRVDKDPSLSFVKYNDKITATDFGNNYYSGDCFHFAGVGLGLNSNNPKSFVTICKHIIAHVNVNGVVANYKPTTELPDTVITDNVVIVPVFRDFMVKDYNYWIPIGITKDGIHNNILAVKSFELIVDGELKMRYYHSYNDPCYAYFLGFINGLYRYKLYLPFRGGKKKKFITNNRFPFDDLLRMKPEENVILIKSIKDRILMTQILNELSVSGIQVIATASENLKLTPEFETMVKSLYRRVYTLFDNDKTGFDNMSFCKIEYGYAPIYLIHSIKELYPEYIPRHLLNESVIIHKDIPKDLSDISKKYTYSTAVNIVKHLLNQLI